MGFSSFKSSDKNPLVTSLGSWLVCYPGMSSCARLLPMQGKSNTQEQRGRDEPSCHQTLPEQPPQRPAAGRYAPWICNGPAKRVCAGEERRTLQHSRLQPRLGNRSRKKGGEGPKSRTKGAAFRARSEPGAEELPLLFLLLAKDKKG